ncbi:MAG: Holo-[acyl-carrier-protein] synthase, partial [uncultured Acidimicrobiales bacterium]
DRDRDRHRGGRAVPEGAAEASRHRRPVVHPRGAGLRPPPARPGRAPGRPLRGQGGGHEGAGGGPRSICLPRRRGGQGPLRRAVTLPHRPGCRPRGPARRHVVARVPHPFRPRGRSRRRRPV